MISVTAKYFAVFREKTGKESEVLLTSAATAGDLFTEVATRHLFSDPMLRCKVAINDELAGWDSGISEGDIVLFFPPVAGG